MQPKQDNSYKYPNGILWMCAFEPIVIVTLRVTSYKLVRWQWKIGSFLVRAFVANELFRRFGIVCAFVESTTTDQPPTAYNSKSLSLSCVRQLLHASRIQNTDSKIVVRCAFSRPHSFQIQNDFPFCVNVQYKNAVAPLDVVLLRI